MQPTLKPYYLLEVALLKIKPRIWRSFLIDSKATFLHLHEAIQDAMGWSNTHLFKFLNPDEKPIAELHDPDGAGEGPDAEEIPISSWFGSGQAKCFYRYDFGDNWMHEVRCLDIPRVPETFGCRLVGGERSCPLEDCGGIPGYQRCARAAAGKLKDPDLVEWVGDWKPDDFDPKKSARSFDRRKLELNGFYGEAGPF